MSDEKERKTKSIKIDGGPISQLRQTLLSPRELRPRRGHFSLRGTIFPSEYCPGDRLWGDTIHYYTATPDTHTYNYTYVAS